MERDNIRTYNIERMSLRDPQGLRVVVGYKILF
jgi:hypothetical protein